MGVTSIQWTDRTWSPLRARVKADAAEIATAKGCASLVQIAGKMASHVGPHCERVSHGCDNCYSDTNNGRCLPANGTGLPFDRRSRDLIEPFVDEKILLQPLKWRKPQRIFVENQSDLFGEWNTDEQIDRVFAVMALCSQHTFQVLTKRPERMLRWSEDDVRDKINCTLGYPEFADKNGRGTWLTSWPLPNVWLGVSVEDQRTADARIPLLLQTPAAKRFVSYEPALGPVDFRNVTFDMSGITHELVANRVARGEMVTRESYENYPKALSVDSLTGANIATELPGLDWIIIGGESGPSSRPFNIAWARQTIEQCKAAGVAAFFKQAGRYPILDNSCIRLHDKKGGDLSELPPDLNVREFPDAIQRPNQSQGIGK